MALQVVLCPSGKFGKNRRRERTRKDDPLETRCRSPSDATEQIAIALFSRCSERLIAIHWTGFEKKSIEIEKERKKTYRKRGSIIELK